MKSNKKKKINSVEIGMKSFLDKRIQRINRNLENKKNKFKNSKNDLFSDQQFLQNISSHSKISLLIKK